MSNWIAFNLRHNKDIAMDCRGWVDIDVLAALSPDAVNRTQQQIVAGIRETVLKDKKGRFEVSESKIRATNGHSITLEQPFLRNITSEDKFTWVVHGTTASSWEVIQQSGGLKKMARDYVHFAVDRAHLRAVTQVQVYLYLDYAQMLKDGRALIITTNNVVGSVEDVPLRYLSVGVRPE